MYFMLLFIFLKTQTFKEDYKSKNFKYFTKSFAISEKTKIKEKSMQAK